MPAEEDGGPAAATVSAELDLGSLEVREGTGGAMPLTDRDRREIKKQMGGILGGGTASFASSRMIPSGSSGGAIEGTVTLNGKTQPARLQLTDSGSGRYRGSATLAQTGFGIKPYTGFFGALKLRTRLWSSSRWTCPRPKRPSAKSRARALREGGALCRVQALRVVIPL